MASATKRKEIRDVFVRSGGVNVRTLVGLCRDSGVYSSDDVDAYALRGMMADARKALCEKNVDGALPGLRFAYPDGVSDEDQDDGGPTWKQLPLFGYDEMCILLARRGKGVLDDHAELSKLRDYCKARFGEAPEIVEILEPAV
jgi:hypothetical protein